MRLTGQDLQSSLHLLLKLTPDFVRDEEIMRRSLEGKQVVSMGSEWRVEMMLELDGEQE